MRTHKHSDVRTFNVHALDACSCPLPRVLIKRNKMKARSRTATRNGACCIRPTTDYSSCAHRRPGSIILGGTALTTVTVAAASPPSPPSVRRCLMKPAPPALANLVRNRLRDRIIDGRGALSVSPRRPNGVATIHFKFTHPRFVVTVHTRSESHPQSKWTLKLRRQPQAQGRQL